MIVMLLRVIMVLIPFALIIFVVAKVQGAKSAPQTIAAPAQSSPLFGLQTLSFCLLAALTLYVATMEVV
ncbi:hypothetical protein EOK75_16965 (plasmid) [Pseudorhodobacter turbinis]|uniref:Uncharacterized protein n=1 Tax=Pseudorhodobacter turbinis TaxID=2500533 RepID=A0A4P8EK19_9RHOB|nr:hypothetical protein [Pseudorhodobacter turbinis]QCO57406.1 hypothetical protein EOK75_16965 [Pseudorhodobacter turbinis]